jgi:IS30 family transposase
MISERPAEAEDRALPGHWEGDLILGLGSSAIGTLVERTTRYVMLLHLPRRSGPGSEARVKNGPALAGHGAEAVRDAIAASILTLPEQLRRSLTWDQGTETAEHAQLRIDTGVEIYFCDPHRAAPTSAATALTSSPASRLHSTVAHARHFAGAHPPKPSTTAC